MKNYKAKICIVSSGGGHLFNLLQLSDWWKWENRFWVAPNKVDVNSVLVNECIYYSYSPVTRNYKNLIKNTLLALKILLKEKPDLVISSGGGIAIPFFYIAKVMGIKTIFIEVYDSFTHPSLTGRLVYKISDYFFIQHKAHFVNYPKAECLGSLFTELQ